MLDLKLAMQLAYIEQEPLYVNFLDLKKAYDTMDRGYLMDVLKGYGASPKMQALIKFFWDNMMCVCKTGGFFRMSFLTTQRATQGGPDSPQSFNVVVNAVI